MSIGGIDARALGPVSVAARAYRRRGRTFVTAIVKATFTLAQDAAMTLAKPSAITWAEQPRSTAPTASVRRTSDCAPLVPSPEILLDAIAFTGGAGISRITTRLAVARGTRMLISKHLEIVGDRHIPAHGPGTNAAPFAHMPIEYERAFGGIGRPENPAGIGQAEPDGSANVPNVRAGEGATAEPPGYGPLSARWPHRRARRGSQRGDGFDPAFTELADDLDDTYYQAAPEDQRVDAWLPGDLVVLAHMHPAYPTLRVTLPTLHGVALVVDGTGRRVPLELRADTLFIEPHLLRAEMIYRGALEIERPDVRVFGAIRGAEPFEWPDDLEESRGAPPQAARYGAEGTLVMDPPPTSPIAGAAAAGRETTLVLEPSFTAEERSAFETTLVLEPPTVDDTTADGPLVAPAASMPFAEPRRGARPAAPLNVAATPWATDHTASAPPVDADPFATTLVLGVRSPAAPEEEPAPDAQRGASVAPAVVEPPRSSKPKRKKAVWRDDPTPALAPQPPVAPPPPEKRPDAREKLYKKFK